MTGFDKIKAITFDIDGVMTDGSLLGFDDGNFIRIYDAKDGFGVRLASMSGIKLAVITGGTSPSIAQRFIKSGVPADDIYLHSRDKIKDFMRFCEKHGLSPEEVAYVGDDIPDIDVIKAAGLGVAPADAVPEVLAVADYVSPFPGGKGCMRDVFEKVLKAQDLWHLDVDTYVKKF